MNEREPAGAETERPSGFRARLSRPVVSVARDVAATRRAFENYVAVGALAGMALPGRIPPYAGSSRLAGRRLAFRTRNGQVLETELGNTWPIIETFRDSQYDVPIDWNAAKTIVDVGGHVGAFAVWAAARARHARIVVFEPEPRNFQDLRSNVDRNGLAERTTLVPAAVAARAGKQRLNVPTLRYTASFARGGEPSTATVVDCVVLERYLREQGFTDVDVLKMDCEGAEWDILPALLRDDAIAIRHLLVECHVDRRNRIETMLKTLAAHGFATQVLTTGAGAAPFPVVATIWGAAA